MSALLHSGHPDHRPHLDVEMAAFRLVPFSVAWLLVAELVVHAVLIRDKSVGKQAYSDVRGAYVDAVRYNGNGGAWRGEEGWRRFGGDTATWSPGNSEWWGAALNCCLLRSLFACARGSHVGVASCDYCLRVLCSRVFMSPVEAKDTTTGGRARATTSGRAPTPVARPVRGRRLRRRIGRRSTRARRRGRASTRGRARATRRRARARASRRGSRRRSVVATTWMTGRTRRRRRRRRWRR